MSVVLNACMSGIWLHELGTIGASFDGVVPEPPRHDCPVSYQDDAIAVPGIVKVKCFFQHVERQYGKQHTAFLDSLLVSLVVNNIRKNKRKSM